MAVAFEAANLFGTRVAETNLASVQYETQQQAGHMNANDPIKLSVQSLVSRGPSTYAIPNTTTKLASGGSQLQSIPLQIRPLPIGVTLS
jgi:hypothetical protein